MSWWSKSSSKQVRNRQGSALLRRAEYMKMKHKEKRTITFALLGTGESGKSTMLRQVRNLYGNGIDQDYRLESKPAIIFNIKEGCIHVLEEILTENEKAGVNSGMGAALDHLIKVKHQPMFEEDSVGHIQSCLKDKRFVQLSRSRNFYLLQDSWFELVLRLENYPEWGGNNWVPSKDDVFLSRIRTGSVMEEYFKVNAYFYKMVDISGQYRYRKSHLMSKHLQGVDVILYVVSLSEYNLAMFEDETKQRFDDSLEFWTKVCNRTQFRDCEVVLFFNKLDVFKEKYIEKGIPLPTTVTDFQPPPVRENEKPDSCENALAWYEDLFLSRIRPENKRSVIVKFTTATDETIMKPIIQAVSNKLVDNILTGRGLAL